MKKFTYFLLAALFGLAVTGCDKTPGDIDKQDGSKQYISFKISAASNSAYTKADYGTDPNEYKDGETAEYAVKNVRFLFYRNGKFQAEGKDLNAEYYSKPENWETDTQADITSHAKDVKCVLEGVSAGNRPDQVLCFLNITADLYNTLKALPNLTDALAYVNAVAADSELSFVMLDGGTYYFTMSNSVHQNADGSVADAVNVVGHIYEDEAQAINDPVTIYVERLAAKVEATRKASPVNTLGTPTDPFVIKDVTGGTDVSTCEVKIVEGAWAINAVNRSAYLTKKIESSTTWAPTAFKWMGLNNAHRMFWEIDPNYTGSYKDYAEDAEDYRSKGTPYMLTNYSTNALLSYVGKALDANYSVVDGTAVSDYSVEDLRARFCLPNTMTQVSGTTEALYNQDLVSHPKKVGTHLIVFAQVTDGTNPVNTFYVYAGNPCTEDLYLQRALANINSSTYGKLYTDVTDPAAPVALTVAELQISKADYDNSAASPRYIVEKDYDAAYTDGYVSVFPADKTNPLYYYDAATDTYKSFTLADTDPVYKETFGKAVVERANKYNKGLMYYAIPIEHAGKNATDPTLNTTGEKDPHNLLDRYVLGAYGVVRNHWYNVTLGDVLGLGKGIDDPREPIVPEEDMVWHLAAQIKINAWHMVNQTSDLK